ncbi:uncharacterized protein LOC106158758 isoform X1 [Lingula anatina]|uniref:Uncharacterized protein LOC106158758 isoform X1 n=1 Tax=Lingula anatina TaxID=7574 RepID=A0A1S3HXL3_LINAN|nr:uncharacterized protein LOC106158758 isoform X1 [Lingula anatina]XP_023933380.1 uncharacterized protein LOC106158758 isoform X1 [Lingula anatina]XP_023933381.1 uncharacterized protein LOC106158758 isoform X1 [Lingula anatina]|eukprot:XP_023933379.1 uncharacterized protein LOC106158758 isoform X1 [Lingula anatina]
MSPVLAASSIQFGPVYVVSCVAVTLILVVLLLLCVCTETKQDKQPANELELQEKRPVSADANDVRVSVTEEAETKEKNGRVTNGNESQNGKKTRNDSRSSQNAATLDRALPAIPITPPSDVFQEEEEEDSENYDLIQRGGDNAADEGESPYDLVGTDSKRENPYAKVKGANGGGKDSVDPYSKVKGKGEDPYSKVKGEASSSYDPYSKVKGDLENTYEKVEDDKRAKNGKKEPPYGKVKEPVREHQYAEVKGQREHVYAEVKDKKKNPPIAAFGDSNDIDKHRKRPTSQPVVSEYVGDPDYELPPVPIKNFGEEEDVSSDQTDPSSPPNGAVNQTLATANQSPTPPQALPSAPPISPPLPAPTVMVSAASWNGEVDTDPSYTKVTARESLASIRAREAQREANEEDFYESVTDADDSVEDDYCKVNDTDLPPPIPTTERSPLAKSKHLFRESVTSDLYAEIAPSGSTRSSAYASVRGTKEDEEEAEDSSEPGYSKIKHKRPHTAFEFPTAPTAAAAKSEGHNQNNSFLYAKVDKKTKNRDKLEPVNGTNTATKICDVSEPDPYDNISPSYLMEPGPVLRCVENGANNDDINTADAGYQTVTDVFGGQGQEDDLDIDPNYATMGDTEGLGPSPQQSQPINDSNPKHQNKHLSKTKTAAESSVLPPDEEPPEGMIHISQAKLSPTPLTKRPVQHVYQEIDMKGEVEPPATHL